MMNLALAPIDIYTVFIALIGMVVACLRFFDQRYGEVKYFTYY